MKTLIIIRHAKSNQSFFGNDFERPLNDRGREDAPVMAKRLLQKQSHIDAFFSSPAKRAKKTAELFAREYGLAADDITLLSSLYHAEAAVFHEVVASIPGHINSAAIFSHNPGITYFVNELTDTTRLDNMPTCGIFAVRADTGTWSSFDKAKKEFLFFDCPKL